jgi:hypothetical protein
LVLLTNLCAGHSNLWAGVDVDPAVGLPADGAAHRVRDPDDESTSSLAVPAHVSIGTVYRPYMTLHVRNRTAEYMISAPQGCCSPQPVMYKVNGPSVYPV